MAHVFECRYSQSNSARIYCSLLSELHANQNEVFSLSFNLAKIPLNTWALYYSESSLVSAWVPLAELSISEREKICKLLHVHVGCAVIVCTDRHSHPHQHIFDFFEQIFKINQRVQFNCMSLEHCCIAALHRLLNIYSSFCYVEM